MKKDVYNDEGDALGFRSSRFQRLLEPPAGTRDAIPSPQLRGEKQAPCRGW